MQTDLTQSQATDLARFFLGPKWSARSNSALHPCHLCFEDALQFAGLSWRDVFRSAGVKLPVRKRFIGRGRAVLREGTVVATATSATYALRIANALNEYEPGDKGY